MRALLFLVVIDVAFACESAPMSSFDQEKRVEQEGFFVVGRSVNH